jgi:hypothetical protein
MATRRGNHLVSVNAAERQLPPKRGFPPTRPGKPPARGPPRHQGPLLSTLSVARSARHGRPALGKIPRQAGPQKERGDVAASPLPNAGLAKLVQLQLATLPGDRLAAYPLVLPIWFIRIGSTTGAG